MCGISLKRAIFVGCKKLFSPAFRAFISPRETAIAVALSREEWIYFVKATSKFVGSFTSEPFEISLSNLLLRSEDRFGLYLNR
jgi:hypothetical protein